MVSGHTTRYGRRYAINATAAGGVQGLQALSPRHWPPLGAFIKLPALRVVHDWALADFSGYVAADELYDGPFCILSAVDNRRYKRILYDVLDHDPTHEDIRVFLGRLQTALVARGLALCGVTTDGSALYPEPLREVFGTVRHQICQF